MAEKHQMLGGGTGGPALHMVQGVRLGQRERKLLHEIVGPDSECWITVSEEAGESVKITRWNPVKETYEPYYHGSVSELSATHRAAKSLEHKGLVERGYKYGQVAVRRTALGQLVVETFGQELETGKRIRWAKLTEAECREREGQA